MRRKYHFIWQTHQVGRDLLVVMDIDRGLNFSSVCVILDFENFSVKHLYRPVLRVISQISDTVEANYPETLGR